MKKIQGFSLIELMVVVAILSVAAAFLVPRYLKDRMKQKQLECRQNLSSLLDAERAFFSKNNSFTTDLQKLGWEPQGKGFYQYLFAPAPTSTGSFVFECVGNIDHDPTLDRLQINETGLVTQITDDLKQ